MKSLGGYGNLPLWERSSWPGLVGCPSWLSDRRVVLGLFLWLVCIPYQAFGVMADRIVAVVDSDVITESELFEEARVALVKRGRVDVALDTLPGEFLDSFLKEYLVYQVLVSMHARRRGTLQVSARAVEDARQLFTHQFRSEAAYLAFLRRFGLSEERLLEILRRDLRNQAYILRRLGLREEEGLASPTAARTLKSWLHDLAAGAHVAFAGVDGRLERYVLGGARIE